MIRIVAKDGSKVVANTTFEVDRAGISAAVAFVKFAAAQGYSVDQGAIDAIAAKCDPTTARELRELKL